MTINFISLKERIALCADFTMQERAFLLDAVNASSSLPDETLCHNPNNYLGRIDHIWAFLSLDDGGEGVCAAPLGGLGVVPMIAADKRRLDSLRPMARAAASAFGKPVRLAKFKDREDVEVFQP